MEKIKVDFGTIISAVQKESGQTQRYFAERIGISPNALINYYNGLTIPNVLIAYKMCLQLGISLDKVCKIAFKGLEVDNKDELKYVLQKQSDEDLARDIPRWKRKIEDYERRFGAKGYRA